MIYALAFIILIGLLVFAHEFGHFLMARICGVRAEIFSLGFGKTILKKKIGFTEYRLSLIPLGGYVKFLGDEADKNEIKKVPAELEKYSFNHQNVYKRALIVFGGPFFNFILAGVLFAFVYLIGEPNVASVIGYVEKDSIAWNAGIREGDNIVAVNGKKINLWMEADDLISKQEKEVALTVKRGFETIVINVSLKELLVRDKFGGNIYKTGIEYIAPFKRAALVGVAASNDTAYKAGFKTGDLIVSIGGTKIESWNDLDKYLSEHKGFMSFKVNRNAKEIIIDADDQSNTANEFGFYPAELFISKFVNQESPAYKAGMKEGDRIVSLNGASIGSFQMLQQEVDRAGRASKALTVVAERGADLLTFIILPKFHDLGRDETGAKDKRFLLGIETIFTPGPTVEKIVKVRNPIKLVWVSLEKTLFWIWITLVGLFKLVTGAVSLKAVGGPLMIGKVAGDSLYLGIVYFLRIMAIISINLGLINLLPVPVLDGGHMAFFTYEAVFRKPMKEKYIMVAQQVGFYILIGLVVLSFYNDILKFGSAILGKFR